jgi:hypothetical protein
MDPKARLENHAQEREVNVEQAVAEEMQNILRRILGCDHSGDVPRIGKEDRPNDIKRSEFE